MVREISARTGFYEVGTHDLLKAKIGDEFEPIEFTITEDMVEKNAFANDDYNPWYFEDSPFGGRITSPTFVSVEEPLSFSTYYASPPGGMLNASMEFEFVNPLKVGKKVRMTGRLVDKYQKRSRDYFVSEYLAVDEDGVEILRIRRTRATPAVVRAVTERTEEQHKMAASVPQGTEPTEEQHKMSTMPIDPTAFRPMKVTASKETEVGFELEPITKKMTLDKMRLFQRWPRSKNIHDDYAAAQKEGLRKPIVQAVQIAEHIGELLIKFFGTGYIGGNISTKIIRMMEVDDEITTKMVVREKVVEGDAIRLILDVSCENQRAERVIVGTASGLVL